MSVVAGVDCLNVYVMYTIKSDRGHDEGKSEVLHKVGIRSSANSSGTQHCTNKQLVLGPQFYKERFSKVVMCKHWSYSRIVHVCKVM